MTTLDEAELSAIQNVDITPGAAHRHEPFWVGRPWPKGQVETEARDVAERDGLLTRWEADMTVAEAQRQIRVESQRDDLQLRVLAAVQAWRHVTVEQLAAIVNMRLPDQVDSQPIGWSDLGHPLHLLFAADLILRGQVCSPLQFPPIVTSHRSSDTRRFLEELGVAERSLITSGTGDWHLAPAGARHNLALSEMLLRLGELPDHLITVPEGLARFHRILECDPADAPRRCGDGIIYREDGLRIVPELTATGTTRRLSNKTNGIIPLLDGTDDAVACFVEAADPYIQQPDEVWSSLCRAVTEVTDLYPQHRNRIAITRWRWIWPGPGKVSDFGTTLGAFVATGNPQRPWEERHLLDVTDFVLPDHARDEAAKRRDEARLLPPVPHWQRDW